LADHDSSDSEGQKENPIEKKSDSDNESNNADAERSAFVRSLLALRHCDDVAASVLRSDVVRLSDEQTGHYKRDGQWRELLLRLTRTLALQASVTWTDERLFQAIAVLCASYCKAFDAEEKPKLLREAFVLSIGDMRQLRMCRTLQPFVQLLPPRVRQPLQFTCLVLNRAMLQLGFPHKLETDIKQRIFYYAYVCPRGPVVDMISALDTLEAAMFLVPQKNHNLIDPPVVHIESDHESLLELLEESERVRCLSLPAGFPEIEPEFRLESEPNVYNVVPVDCAYLSPILSRTETFCRSRVIHFWWSNQESLDLMAKLLIYNAGIRDDEEARNRASDRELVFRDSSQGAVFDCIMLSYFLNIQPVVDDCCQHVASMIKGKTPEELRKTFNIKNDFTPEEEEQIRRENEWCEER
jgi:hypothetical protein